VEGTGFEDRSLQEVLENYLYTSANMFGEVVFDAERELFRRIPPPEWAKKHPIPTMAKEWHDECGHCGDPPELHGNSGHVWRPK